MKEITDMLTARKAITDKHGKGKPQFDTRGAIDCPVCKVGELSYRIAAYNGHIHAACSTPGCVRWLE